MKRMESWVLVGLTVGTAMALVAYLIQFAGPLSDKPHDFAEFGDYFGGLVGSLAALATVLLVWRTLARMEEANLGLASQLNAMRTQVHRSDVRQRLELIQRDIECDGSPLSTPIPDELAPLFREFELDAPVSLRETLCDYSFPAHAQSIATEIFLRVTLRRSVALAGQQMKEMSDCLRLYDRLSDTKHFTDYFRGRYAAIADALCEIGALDSETHREISPCDSLHAIEEDIAGKKLRCSHGFHRGAETARKIQADRKLSRAKPRPP